MTVPMLGTMTIASEFPDTSIDNAAGIIAGGSASKFATSDAIHDAIASMAGSGSMTIASQAEAEAGTDNTKAMTPLRVKQSITANAGGGSGTFAGLADVDLTGLANLSMLYYDGAAAKFKVWDGALITGTPYLFGSTTAGTFSASGGSSVMRAYRPHPKLVSVRMALQNVTLTGATGEMRVEGLPFPAAGGYCSMSVSQNGLTVNSGKTLQCLIIPGETHVRLQWGDPSGGAAGSVSATDTSITALFLNGEYEIA